MTITVSVSVSVPIPTAAGDEMYVKVRRHETCHTRELIKRPRDVCGIWCSRYNWEQKVCFKTRAQKHRDRPLADRSAVHFVTTNSRRNTYTISPILQTVPASVEEKANEFAF